MAAGRVALIRRGVLGLTQLEVAERAGVDVQTLRTLETGERWPIAKSLEAISAVLGFGPGYLRAVADSEPAKAAS